LKISVDYNPLIPDSLYDNPRWGSDIENKELY